MVAYIRNVKKLRAKNIDAHNGPVYAYPCQFCGWLHFSKIQGAQGVEVSV